MGVWRGILSVKEAFFFIVRYWGGIGEYVILWHDIWVGERSLVANFLPSFIVCLKIYMERAGRQVGWYPLLRRNLPFNIKKKKKPT